MGHRLSKLYTRQGDMGTTRLADGQWVSKAHPRIQAGGAIDELNSHLGLLLCEPLPEPLPAWLHTCQHRLFELGGELSLPEYQTLTTQDTQQLETQIDQLTAQLPPLKEFILPGGNRPAALAHLARCCCRRAESLFAELHHHTPLRPDCLSYLNRLSDLLFAMARTLARQAGGQEPLWLPRGNE